MAEWVCVICKQKYDDRKGMAEMRGFCSRACEHELEKRVGIPGLRRWRKLPLGERSRLRALFRKEAARLRVTTEDADVVEPFDRRE